MKRVDKEKQLINDLYISRLKIDKKIDAALRRNWKIAADFRKPLSRRKQSIEILEIIKDVVAFENEVNMGYWFRFTMNYPELRNAIEEQSD